MWRPLVSLETLACLALIVIADGFVLCTDLRWVGEWGWTPEWANGGLFLASSLVAGVSAHLAVPYLRPGFRDSVGPGTVRAAVLGVGAAWARGMIVGLAAHAVVTVAAVTATAVTRPTDALLPLAFVYPLLPLALSTSLGLAVVAFAPSRVAAALVVGLSYVVAFQAATGAIPLPYIVGGQTVSMVGLSYSPMALGVFAAAGAWATAILLGSAVSAVRLRSVVSAAAVTVLGLTAAIVVPSLAVPHLPDRVVVSASDGGFVCTGRSPRVCLADGHTRRLSTVADGVAQAARRLRSAGVDLAGVTLREELPGRARVETGVLLLPESYLNEARFTRADYATALTRPRDCDDYSGGGDSTQGDQLLALAGELAGWIAAPSGGGQAAGPAPASAPAPAPRASPSWARAAFAALRSCHVPDELRDGRRW